MKGLKQTKMNLDQFPELEQSRLRRDTQPNDTHHNDTLHNDISNLF
jgi:hypothetical protein